jgi:mycothiol system anti-sigma-R factor
METRTDQSIASSCARFASSTSAYLDGELDPDHAADVEEHLAECAECAERLATSRAVRVSLKRVSTGRASESLRERVCAAMSQERARARAADQPVPAAAQATEAAPAPRMLRLRYAVAFAAAAGVAFAMGMTRMSQPPPGDLASPRRAPSTAASATASLDAMLDELVALHADPLPPETKNPDELPRFDPLVGVPVRRPAFQPRFDANFDGARVHAMRDRRRAALLLYTLHNKHRVTVYVFDPQKMPVRETRLQPRVVRDRERRERELYVGTFRGYSVAAEERAGVGYAFASDLGDEESTQLALAVVQ